jgi:tetrahydromethanopterin S-methyltransferase subunit C
MADRNYQTPTGVILVEIYGFLVGIANIIGGFLLIANHNNATLVSESFKNPGSLIAVGVISIVIGAMQAVLSYFLGQGNNAIRMVFVVVASFNLIIGLWATLVLSGTELASGIISAIFSGLILYLLLNHRADEFFGHPYK